MKVSSLSFSLAILSFLLSTCLTAQLTIVVDAWPEDTPEGDQVYIAGNFQGWNPGDTDYVLADDGQGNVSITMDLTAGNLIFKFTRGSWDTVEGNVQGQFLPDRTYTYGGGTETLTLQIVSWEDVGTGSSTAADNVSILSTDFYMPQLDANRRIWIYLPPDYDGSNLDYPVMYMHDGQNVFDANTSFSGEWEVDETLNDLHEQGDPGIIVVAIDNGGAERINEYSPWNNPSYGGGDGDAYMQFIISTLKPYIDENYRTLPGRESTALMGSSLGGLISHYGAVEYEEVFSRVGIFSPSYWFADEAYTIVTQADHEQEMRLFLLAGELEGSGSVVDDAEAMIDTFLANGYTTDELNLQTHADGQHSEWYWRREFGEAYQWLFAEPLSAPSLDKVLGIELFPNPTSDIVTLRIEDSELDTGLQLQLTDLFGRVLLQGNRGTLSLNLKAYPSGNYLLKASHPDYSGVKVWTVVKQ
jgi:predicted alpha/beta superfamily hydrolase